MYYVYILINPNTSLPFYVGVGKRNRCSHIPREQQHIVDAIRLKEGKKLFRPNKHKLHTILNILDSGKKVDIRIVAEYDSENDAFKEEIRLIAVYGRKDLHKGPLTNLTDGPEGGVNPSPETVAKISAALKGKPSHLKGAKLGPYTNERKQNISKAVKGRLSPNKGKKMDKAAWNKGLTKETSESVAKYSVPNPKKGFQKGHSQNNGMVVVKDCNDVQYYVTTDDARIKTGELVSIHVGRPGWNKGKTISTKGKTYEEIYGPEKAAEIKEKRRLNKIQYWEERKQNLTPVE